MTILAIILGAALGWVRWAWTRRQHDLRDRYTPPAGDDRPSQQPLSRMLKQYEQEMT